MVQGPVFVFLLFFFVKAFAVLCGTCGGGILKLKQRNLSKQCLLGFLSLNIKIKPKLDHEGLCRKVYVISEYTGEKGSI